MYRTYKQAFGAGYRAGRAAAYADTCPYTLKNPIRLAAWSNGWHKGIMERIQNNLTVRGY